MKLMRPVDREMPYPGPSLAKYCLDRGDCGPIFGDKKATEQRTHVLRELVYELLYRRCSIRTLLQGAKGDENGELLPWLPGHLWGYRDAPERHGPRPAEVMIIGKMPGADEVQNSRLFCGPSSELFHDTLATAGVVNYSRFYLTNIVRFRPPGDVTGSVRASWVKDCSLLLQQELSIVRPKYILCLGSDALKGLLGNKYTLTSMEGRVAEHEFTVIKKNGRKVRHKSLVMAMMHPAAVLRAPDMEATFERLVYRFRQLITGTRFDKEEEGIEHYVVTDFKDLDEKLAMADREYRKTKFKMIAVDAEWHGKHPQSLVREVVNGVEKFVKPYVRTIQFSWAPKKAICVRLRSQNGRPGFQGGLRCIPAVVKKLNEFFKDKRVGGHFFVSDLEWLCWLGLDLRKQFAAPYKRRGKTLPWERMKEEGGFDTALASHAVEETSLLGLEALTMRYTTAPRYDAELEKEIKDQRKVNKLSREQYPGFGWLSNETLEKYANYDADVTRRIMEELLKRLDNDGLGNNSWKPFWISMRATEAVYEINTTGMLVDRDHYDKLVDLYSGVRDKLHEEILEIANWPDFNLSSVPQMQEFLFGDQFAKKDKSGKPIRLRPKGALTLNLTPITTTGTPPRRWIDVVRSGEEHKASPSTGKSVLEAYANDPDNPHAGVAAKLRDFRYINQVLRNTLRPPLTDKSGVRLTDSRGRCIYSRGFGVEIGDDDRVRTHILQTADTGRWKSSRPNMQNWSKTRETDYRRILGADYVYPLRSAIIASPGMALVEADYTGAELAVAAIMSGDKQMIEHCRRGQLPDDDPDYFDIHSNIAKLAFRLDCPPTKKGLKSVPNRHNPSDPEGMAYTRGIAKTVIFGVMYGRGAKAIALAARQQGVQLSDEEAQAVIDTIFETYPKLDSFFRVCRDRVVDPRWLQGAMGRFRRFPFTNDEKLIGQFGRKAMNFPIQGVVADVVSRAVDNLVMWRKKHNVPNMYRIVMQIHDAVILEVPFRYVDTVYGRVMDECMRDSIKLRPRALDGSPTSDKKLYTLGMEKEVFLRWGVHLTKEECRRVGISEVYAK